MNPKELYKLLTKYHLVRETEYQIGVGEMYVFHPMDKVYEGCAVGYGLIGMPMVSFAKEVKFTVTDGVPYITCFGWDKPITEDKYEAKLATLEKQFNEAINDYKKYIVKQRLKKMKKDFK
jgi:hypothetical protein